MSSLPSIPRRSTGTTSNPNSYYCLCKLRVRSLLSREIAGTSTQSSRIYKQLSPECPLLRKGHLDPTWKSTRGNGRLGMRILLLREIDIGTATFTKCYQG